MMESTRALRIEKGDTLKMEVEGGKIILRSMKIPESPTLKMLDLAEGSDKFPEAALLREVKKLEREKVP